MENQNPTPEESTTPTEIEIISPTAVISIKMSTGYYRRVQDATMSMVANRTPEEVEAAHKQIAEQNISEDWVKHYETLLILCKEFETICRQENQVEKVTPEKFMEMMEKFNS